MDTVKMMLAATLLFFGVAAQASSNDLMVAEATGPFTSSPAEQALTQKAIETLQADDKLKGVITVESHGDTVNLAGTVHSVAMIYRSVEVLRDNGVDKVDVGRLETD